MGYIKINNNLSKNFRERANRMLDEYQEKVANTIADIGTQYATEYYGGTSITVEKPKPAKDGETVIIAKDNSERKHIIFMEYGIGAYAQGTYEGNLPSGYQYYYNSEYKTNKDGSPVMKNGQLGWKSWKNHKMISIGYPAQQQMWNTAKSLRAVIRNRLIDYNGGENE